MNKWIGIGVAAAAVAIAVGVVAYETTKNKKHGCVRDSDCASGMNCINGTCGKLGGCVKDGCPDGFHCNEKTNECITDGTALCKTSSDCPSGFGCLAGECSVPTGMSCKGDGDCPLDWGCFAGGCKDKCYVDTDCFPGYHCVNGKCIAA